MSYENGTPNYNLPQTVGSDKRDWSDTNQAFADLDAAVKRAVDDADTALNAAQGAQSIADDAATAAANAVTTANAASAAATSAGEAAALARTDASSALTAAQTATTTAQAAQTTASNADTLALQAQTNIGTMSNLNTQDKTSLVAAINEVLSQIGGSMPELDIANTTDANGITTQKAGCLMFTGFPSSGGAITGAVGGGSAITLATAKGGASASIVIHYVPAGVTVAFAGTISSDVAFKFIPYKD